MKPNQFLNSSKKTQIENMFDSISVEYDFLNRVMTFGNDIRWKKKMYSIAKSHDPKTILDIATGTADIALELAKIKDAKIIAKKPDVEEEIKQPKYIYKKDIQFIFKKNEIELVFKLLCNQ